MITKNGWYCIQNSQVSREKLFKIQKDLSCIEPYTEGKYKKTTFSVLVTSGGKTYIPREYGVNNFGAPKLNLLSDGKNFETKRIFTAKLRDYQANAIRVMKEKYNTGCRGGILKFGCGAGKTLTSLAFAAEIGKKVLIVVDKDSLVDQWTTEIAKCMPGGQVRCLSRSHETPGDINICVAKTLAMGKKYKWRDFVDIGLVILDEVHMYLTPFFLKIFWCVSRRFILGLTATNTRPSKLEYLLDWFVGPILYEFSGTYIGEKPVVHKYTYDCPEPEKYAQIISDKNRIEVVKMYKQIMIEDPHRRRMLVFLITEYAKDGRVLVICLFRKQAEQLAEILSGIGMSVGLYYSGSNITEAKKKHIIIATRAMGAQSLDIPDIRQIIFSATYVPKNNGLNSESLEQLVGRVLRMNHKKSPVIVDIVDNFSFYIRHWKLREAWYQDKGYIISAKMGE